MCHFCENNQLKRVQTIHGVILRARGLGHTLSFGIAAAAAAVDEAAEVLVLLAAAAAVGSAGQRSLGSGRL